MIPSDRQLIARYLKHNERFALDQLICRHLEMVMKVCRKMLPQTHDADDAFQATFLVLAKKIHSVQDRNSVAGWLYEVAIRNCLQIRQRRFRSREIEMNEDTPFKNGESKNQSDAAMEPWQILTQSFETEILLREINRLPAKYREVIVLSCIDEHSRRDTANMLNRTEGAVKGLLARGRSLLKHRLVRRGITSSIAVASLQTGNCFGSAAPVPLSLLESTLETCTQPSTSISSKSIATATANVSTNTASMATPTKLAYVVAAASARQMSLTAASRVGAIAAALLLLIAIPFGVIAEQSFQVNDRADASPSSNQAILADSKVEVLAIVSNDQQTAQKVWNLANENPTEQYFGKLANQYSVEPASKNNFGVVPPVVRGTGRPNLEEEAFRLQKGEISNIVQVGENWVTLFCRGRPDPQNNPTWISEIKSSPNSRTDPSTLQDTETPNEQLERVKEKLADLNKEFETLTQRLGSEHPATIALKKQIDAWNRFIEESDNARNDSPKPTPRPRTAQEARQLVTASKIRPRYADAEFSEVVVDLLTHLQTFSRAGKHGFEIFRQSEGGGKVMLRIFLDSNGDNKLDHWIYFKDGAETYRDVDSNFDGRANYCITTNNGKSRRAKIDNDKVGKRTFELVNKLQEKLKKQVATAKETHEEYSKLAAKGFLAMEKLDEAKLELAAARLEFETVATRLKELENSIFSDWESVETPTSPWAFDAKDFFDYNPKTNRRY